MCLVMLMPPVEPNAGPTPAALALAGEIAAAYAALPQVVAVALAGSQTTGSADPDSDLDIYVYLHADLPVSVRAAVAAARAVRAEVDNQFWEPGDEWIEVATGRAIDVMFRSTAWIEAQIERVLHRHEASVGYSTCFWHNLASSQALFDRDGWFYALQQRAARPYPEPLRRAIIAKNHPILRRTISSYAHQLERAFGRGDLVSVNHRIAALLASYFDILFAVNRLPHPGEKRLVALAQERCTRLPPAMPAQMAALLAAANTGAPATLAGVHALLDGLDRLLVAEGLLPSGDEGGPPLAAPQ